MGNANTRRAALVVASMWIGGSGCAEGSGDELDDVLRSGVLGSMDVLQGPYQVLQADGEDGTSWRIHRVVVNGEPVELQLDDDDPPAIAPRSIVRVYGDADADGFVVDDLEVLAPPPQPQIGADPFAPRKLALLVLHWGTPDLDLGDADERLFTGATSSRNYFSEISYGKESFQGDVFGPYELPYSGCNADWIAQQARDVFIAEGNDPTQYEQFMYYFPSASCGWGGLAMLGTPQQPERDSWYNGSFGCVVRNQEVAHNYGIMHTRFYSCWDGGGQVPFSSNCSYEEYGSPYDPMGYGCGHMATPDKHYMGWLEGCNLVTATADATFNVVPTETPCNGIQALRLPTFDGRQYYIEYRQPIGFDAEEGTSGVLVHVSGAWDWFGPDAYLIDLGEGAFMHAGDAYTDPEGTVTFTVLEEHDTHAVVKAEFPGGGSGSATCEGGGAPPEQAGVIGTLECTGGPFQPDHEPPVVSIRSPHDGQQFAPDQEFDLEVQATDDVAVLQVAVYLDDALVNQAAAPPYEWVVTQLPIGMHTFVAVASDGVHEATSTPVVVEITETPSSGDGPGAMDDGGEGGGEGGVDDGGDDGGHDPDGDDDPALDPALPPAFGLDGDGGGCNASGRTPGGWHWLVLGLLVLPGAVQPSARSGSSTRITSSTMRRSGGSSSRGECRRIVVPRTRK
jgi:hypothetical protein